MIDEQHTHVRHEADFLSRMEDRVHRRIAGREDPKSTYLTWAIENRFETIQSLDRALFHLPRDAVKFLSADEARVLQELLFDVWELNERFAGRPQAQALVEINGLPEQHEVIERGLAWARRYVARRLQRRSTRDQGCPYRQFVRLYNELVPFLDQIGLVEGPDGEKQVAGATGQFLGQVCDFIAWSFFEATWGPELKWKEHRAVGLLRLPAADPLVFEQCKQVFQIYGWSSSRIFEVLLGRMARGLAGGERPVAPEAERARIASLAADLNEMRPFLVRNFRPAKARVELPGEIVAHFTWAQNDRIGILRCAASERELLEQDHRVEVVWPLGIDHRGMLTCYVNPWRNVSRWDGDLPAPALTVGRVVLEAVHQKLFSFYDKLDVAGLLARWRATPEASEPAAPEEEVQVIAASIAAATAAEPARTAGRVTSSLRLSRLTSMLERHFCCSSRSGKGSELLFYREGGMQAFVARHKQNPTVSAVEIRRILKKLGISVRERMRTDAQRVIHTTVTEGEVT